MIDYKTQEFISYHGLRKVAYHEDRTKEVKEAAKRILKDEKLFKDFVLLKIERKEAIERKKVLKEAKKNLTGWKKWCKIILSERLILG